MLQVTITNTTSHSWKCSEKIDAVNIIFNVWLHAEDSVSIEELLSTIQISGLSIIDTVDVFNKVIETEQKLSKKECINKNENKIKELQEILRKKVLI